MRLTKSAHKRRKGVRESSLHCFLAMAVVGGTLLLGACTPAEKSPNRLTDKIDELLLQQTERGLFSGSVLVAKEGQILLEVALRPWVKDRFFGMLDGQFTGLMVAFDRDGPYQVPGLTLDAYGCTIRAKRFDD